MSHLTSMYKDLLFLNGHVADPQLAVSLTTPPAARATPRSASTARNTPWSTTMNFFKSLMYLGGLESADLRLDDEGSPFRPTYGNRIASEAAFGKRDDQSSSRERRTPSDRRATATTALPAGCR